MSRKPRVLSPSSFLDRDLLMKRCEELDIKPQHVGKMYLHMLSRGVQNVRDVPQLPKALCELVEREFQLPTSRLVESKTSADSSTTKVRLRRCCRSLAVRACVASRCVVAVVALARARGALVSLRSVFLRRVSVFVLVSHCARRLVTRVPPPPSPRSSSLSCKTVSASSL